MHESVVFFFRFFLSSVFSLGIFLGLLKSGSPNLNRIHIQFFLWSMLSVLLLRTLCHTTRSPTFFSISHPIYHSCRQRHRVCVLSGAWSELKPCSVSLHSPCGWKVIQALLRNLCLPIGKSGPASCGWLTSGHLIPHFVLGAFHWMHLLSACPSLGEVRDHQVCTILWLPFQDHFGSSRAFSISIYISESSCQFQKIKPAGILIGNVKISLENHFSLHKNATCGGFVHEACVWIPGVQDTRENGKKVCV